MRGYMDSCQPAGRRISLFPTQKEYYPCETLAELLSSVAEKHLVILDGYVDTVMMHVDLRNKCVNWLKKSMESRRLVIVSSMSSLVKATSPLIL